MLDVYSREPGPEPHRRLRNTGAADFFFGAGFTFAWVSPPMSVCTAPTVVLSLLVPSKPVSKRRVCRSGLVLEVRFIGLVHGQSKHLRC